MNISEEKNLRYHLALMNIEGIGPINARKIISKYKNISELFEEKKSTEIKIDGISETLITRIKNFKDFEKIDNEIEYIKAQNIKLFTILDENYPTNLKECYDAPIILFSKGNIQFQNRKIISLVGTRNMTAYGNGFIKELIQEIAKYNPIIVSGYAYGVDICAHLNAIENNLQTIAVLGHGLNQTYPKIHKKYNQLILENGGFVTEFTTFDIFKKENFLKRNRIVAGLANATLIIESALKGGSLSTAKLANEYHRDVFALPGRNTDLMSQGCNYLIKTNQANLLTSVDDLVYYLNWDKENKNVSEVKPYKIPENLNLEELKVISYLKENGPEILDIIALQTEIPVYKLSVILLNLELRSLILPLPGKLFELKK